jgi:4-amino-4-deoxy-L-arabinose transferase-like glycosyltransferase
MSLAGRWLSQLTLGRILIVAAIVRIAWIALCPNEPTSDQLIYHISAVEIAEGHGYVDQSGNPANFWPVGYSALLVPFYWVFGAVPSSAFVANFVLSLWGVWGVDLLARELFGERVRKLASLAAALYPSFVFYTTCLASENAYVPGMVWAVWLGVRASRAPRALPWAALAGLGIGLVAYVRATVVLLVPVIVLLLWLERRQVKDVLGRGAVVAAFAWLALLPWSIRDYKEFGSLTPFSMNGGANFWMGNHPGGTGGYTKPPADVMNLRVDVRDKELGRRAWEFVSEHPLEYAKLCVVRAAKTLATDTSAVVWDQRGIDKTLGESAALPLKILSTLVHYALLALVLLRSVELWRTRSWSRADSVLAATVAALSVPFVFIVSGNRYHLPIIPFLIIWAAASAPKHVERARAPAIATAE